MKIMASEADPTQILNQRNAEVAQIRQYADLTQEAKERRIAEVTERYNAEYEALKEAEARRLEENLASAKKAVFIVPVGNSYSDAEIAQVYQAFEGFYSDVLFSTPDPLNAQEGLEDIPDRAEKTGNSLLARAVFYRGQELGLQPIVDKYLKSRPKEAKAWQRYTEAQEEMNQSRGLENLLSSALTDRVFSSGA